MESARESVDGTSLVGDERLARLVAAGNAVAFAELYERYQAPLLRYCRSILREEEDAQDAVQSAFVRALAALQRDPLRAPLRPWLYRIAHNEAISLLRRRSAGARLSHAIGQQAVVERDWSADRERLGLLVADLRELPQRQRRALLLRELSGLSHAEIASALGGSVTSAKQAIFEARATLGEFAEGRAITCEEISDAITVGDGRALRSRRVRAHLRECAACATLAAGARGRGKRIRALVPPLCPVALQRLLGRVLPAKVGSGIGVRDNLAQIAASGEWAGPAAAVKALVVTAAVGATAVGTAGSSVFGSHHMSRSAIPETPAMAAAISPPTSFRIAAVGQADRSIRTSWEGARSSRSPVIGNAAVAPAPAHWRYAPGRGRARGAGTQAIASPPQSAAPAPLTSGSGSQARGGGPKAGSSQAAVAIPIHPIPSPSRHDGGGWSRQSLASSVSPSHGMPHHGGGSASGTPGAAATTGHRRRGAEKGNPPTTGKGHGNPGADHARTTPSTAPRGGAQGRGHARARGG